jgi:hypothetical protein
MPCLIGSFSFAHTTKGFAIANMGMCLWEVIVVRAKVGISYHGVASLIPPSDLPTLSVVGKGEVTIIKH